MFGLGIVERRNGSGVLGPYCKFAMTYINDSNQHGENNCGANRKDLPDSKFGTDTFDYGIAEC